MFSWVDQAKQIFTGTAPARWVMSGDRHRPRALGSCTGEGVGSFCGFRVGASSPFFSTQSFCFRGRPQTEPLSIQRSKPAEATPTSAVRRRRRRFNRFLLACPSWEAISDSSRCRPFRRRRKRDGLTARSQLRRRSNTLLWRVPFSGLMRNNPIHPNSKLGGRQSKCEDNHNQRKVLTNKDPSLVTISFALLASFQLTSS